ncbi:pilus assembly protein PilM [Oscillibacter sp.]|uniref:pilus assembly protein PilM n=1 Tax=Oscillibacter sp. TaxID=1945593 RepID=UPI00261547BD|nr:pilus assembly protein PilM [Oscillibacter sp.]MDD3347407.1 pilus assembly protein PilM [Oscillibacter sp.]
MAVKVLNIEIGDRLAKVCQSNKLGKNYQIKESFMFQIPDQYVSDGQIMNPTALGLLLKETLSAHGVSDVKNTTFTLSSSKIASREVLLPPVKDNRLKAVVETNAADYFPVDLSNYQIAHNLLQRVQEPEPGCRVLVMAAPKPLLMSYARLADEAGLILDNLDYSGNSQYQVLRSIPGQDPVMYVDVNINSTMVSFVQDGVLLLQRSFGFGGDELVFAAQRAAGMSDEQYLETLEKATNPQWLNTVLPEEEQANCLSRLISGIARSADFFKSSRLNSPVSRVVLIGTCCQLAGLQERIARALGKETVLLTSVSGVKFLADSIEGVSSYISCIGSLLSPLELMPEELRRKKQLQKKRQRSPDSITFGVAVCAACTAVAIALTVFAVANYLLAVNRRNTMQARMEELSNVAQVHDTYLEYQSMTGNLQVVAGYADSPNAQLEAFLTELERKMPSSLLLLSASCSAEGVTMNITTPGMEEAAVVISQLRSFESIVSMTVSTITEAVDDTGFTTASFSVSCGYEAAPVEETAQAGDAPQTTEDQTLQAQQPEAAQ